MEPNPPSRPNAHAIFLEALEKLLPEERLAFLDEACAGHPTVREAVETLLREHQAKFVVSTTLSGRPADKATVKEGPGDTIGRYKLRRKIGEGGCGVVFMADQREPVQREVALKIVRLGMDTEEVVASFAAERQALAMMEHPHIAQVLDAGATPAGRPYFVMELVRGEPITKFCDEQRLTTAQRLKLMVQICHAVQHAHQKGIVHRDLKPSNILVTLHDGEPVPKVIDFGIAKAIAGRLTDKTLFTAYDQFVGTPAYMSPEQADTSNLDVDTRSDVYSLGVLLYELLTGQPPLDPAQLQSVSTEEIRRQVREVEALRPSLKLKALDDAALATLAAKHGSDRARLVSDVRGDLDWITMRCLEKDRERRYESASALADDIERHLENQPIIARPPGRWYALQKLALRHRAAFVATSGMCLALVLGFGVATRSYFNEKAARQQAEDSRIRADEQTALVQLALNNTDYRIAIDLVEQDKAPEAVAHLVRAIRHQRDDRPAEALLASILTTGNWAVPTTEAIPSATGPSRRGIPPNRGGQFGVPGGRRGNRGTAAAPLKPDAKDLNGKWLEQPATAGQAIPGGLPKSPDGKWLLHRLPLENGLQLLDANAPNQPPVAELMRLGGDLLELPKFDPNNSRSWTTTTTVSSPANARGPNRGHTIVWNLPDRPALEFTLPETAGLTVSTAIWNSDNNSIATVAETENGSGSVRVWDAKTGQPISPPMLHDRRVDGIAFDPVAQRIASVTQGGDLRLWDAKTGQQIAADVTAPHPIPSQLLSAPSPFSIAFSPDGKLLLCKGANRIIRVRDAATLSPVPAFARQAGAGLEDKILSSAAFSADNRRIVTVNNNLPPPSSPLVTVWDRSTGAKTLEFSGDGRAIASIAFSPDGKLIVTSTTDGAARTWDAATGEPVSSVMQQGEENTENLEGTFSPDGKRVLTIARQAGGAARVWDAESGVKISALIQPDHSFDDPDALAPFTAAFSRDGRWVVTGGADARIWDATTGLAVSVSFPNQNISLSPDARRLLSVSAAGGVSVWDFADEIAPDWILDLADALARCQFDETGSLDFFRGAKPVVEIKKLADSEKDGDQSLVRWARHLLATPPPKPADRP